MGNVVFFCQHMTQKNNYLTSSDPHRGKLFCHSFWHLIWKYIWHIFSDILVWHSFWHFILTFFSAILSGIYSDILFSILSGIYSEIPLVFFLSGILSDHLSGIYSDILSGISCGTLCGILSGVLSGILSDKSSEILCGRGPAGNTLNLSLLFGSGGDHCDHELAVEVRKRRRGMRRRTRPADLKSNNPNLTCGESGCSHQPRTYVIIIWVCAIKNIYLYICI